MIGCGNCASVKPHRSFGYRQAQSGTTQFAARRILHAEKWPKNMREQRWRDALTMIPHGHDCEGSFSALRTCHGDFDRCPFRSVHDGIPRDVFNRAPQRVLHRVDRAWSARQQLDGPVGTDGFEIRVRRDIFHQT